MNRKHLALALSVFVLSFVARATAAPFALIDQQNLTGGGEFLHSGTFPIGVLIGQSFTPTLNGVDAVELSMRVDTGSIPISGWVEILDGVSGTGGVDGTVLATSESKTISNTTFEAVHFDFPTTVALTPGNAYVAAFNLRTAEAATWFVEVNDANPYGGGSLQGSSFIVDNFSSFDAVFTEGLHTPEPSTYAALTSLGLVGLCFGAHRRRNRAKS